jgi:hypothetical protein
MTLLTIVQEVAGRLALTQPTAVVGSADAQVMQLFALVKKSGHDLAQAHTWQAMTEQQSFVTTATPGQGTAIPADFDRFVPGSIFNRSTRRQVAGPITPQQWQALQANPVYGTVYLMFRQRLGQFMLTPTPPAGQTVAYEYVLAFWAKSAGGAAQLTFLADTDTAFLDETLIADDVVWRFLRAKGMSYAEEMATFERNLEQARGRDGGSGTLNLAPAPFDPFRANIPDGNFGA